MFEGGLGLTVWIRDFRVVQPFAYQEGLAVYFWRHLADMLDVALLHGEDEIRLVQHRAINLSSTVGYEFQSVVLQHFMCSFVHRFAYQGTYASRADRQAFSIQSVFEQRFGRGASADVAHADNQYVVKHGLASQPRIHGLEGVRFTERKSEGSLLH